MKCSNDVLGTVMCAEEESREAEACCERVIPEEEYVNVSCPARCEPPYRAKNSSLRLKYSAKRRTA